jgi:4-amino-4-deoxy-L-arabinose transferase-like glycosyltransferase
VRPGRLAPPALVLAAAYLLIVLTHGDYGIAWDEAAQATYGELVRSYFATLGRDESYATFYDLRHYGPGVELLYAALTTLFPGDVFARRHLFNALLVATTVVPVYGLARMAGGARSGWAAMLALVLLPRFYGDWFHNSKDAPFACATAWYLLALARALVAPAFGPRHGLACGVALGAALAVRPAGIVLLAPLTAVGVVWRWASSEDVPRQRLRLLAGILGALVLAAGLTLALWPWAHRDPLGNAWGSILTALRFPDVFPVLYRGDHVASDSLPWHYLPWYLTITTPIATLLLAAAGAARAARALLRRPRSAHDAPVVIVLAWLAFAVLAFVVLRPNVYDGIRHFLFLLPAVAVLAGWGAQELVQRLRRPRARSLAAVLVFAGLAWPVRDMVALHPYQYTYFNELTGGMARASRHYDTDYWLTSYREAMAWINDRQLERGRALRVLVIANAFSLPCAAHYAARGMELDYLPAPGEEPALPAEFDYYLATTRNEADRAYPSAEVVFRVERKGAIFSVVRRSSAEEVGEAPHRRRGDEDAIPLVADPRSRSVDERAFLEVSLARGEAAEEASGPLRAFELRRVAAPHVVEQLVETGP